MSRRRPYAETASEYLAHGFSPVPIPYRKKVHPPVGFTGHDGVDVTSEQAEKWCQNGKGGSNIALRTPPDVIGLDVDHYGDKHGGDTLQALVDRLGSLPPTWRSSSRSDDPVSGIRFYRVPPGRRWADVAGPSIEVVQHGHRYAIVAPSEHPEGRTYGWYGPDGLPATATPRVDDLPDLPAAWIAELDAGSSSDHTPSADLAADEARAWLAGLPRGKPCRAVRRVLDDAVAALERADGTTRHSIGRNAALGLLRLGEQGHTGAPTALARLKRKWRDALGDDRTDDDATEEWKRIVVGGVRKALGNPTPDEDKGCCGTSAEEDFDEDVDDSDDSDDADGKKPKQWKGPLAVRLREHVEKHYDVFPAGGDGRIFVLPKGGGRAEEVSGGFVMRAASGIGSRAGTFSAAATEAAKVLTAQAATREPRHLAMRVHYRPDRIVLDLAQRGSTRCVVITAKGWTVEDVPPTDIVFQASGLPLPDPERGGSVDELRTLLRWSEDDPRWPLLKGWPVAALMADLPRPMVGFFGPQGSAKTSTGRFTVGILDPKPKGALGGGFGKNRSDDETKAFKSYLVAWDNVTSLSDEGADLLSRLVTGDLIERRRLYSDSDLITLHYRRTGVVTGITVPTGIKPDTLDRFIMVALEPMSERMSEGALEAEWERAHPRILAGVLDLAVKMLSGAGANPAGLRMADYAEALWAIDPALYWAYTANVGSTREVMAAEDPFVATIRAWLEHEGGSFVGTATEAMDSAGYYVNAGQWWPNGPRPFGHAITRATELLRAVGVTVTREPGGTHGYVLKRYTLEVRDDDVL